MLCAAAAAAGIPQCRFISDVAAAALHVVSRDLAAFSRTHQARIVCAIAGGGFLSAGVVEIRYPEVHVRTARSVAFGGLNAAAMLERQLRRQIASTAASALGSPGGGHERKASVAAAATTSTPALLLLCLEALQSIARGDVS